MEVRALVCEAHVPFAVACYASAVKRSNEPVELVVHDDGSLSAASYDKLRAGVPGVRMVSRQEADDVVAPLLKGRPALREWRAQNPLALKILDTVLLSSAHTYRYVDSDVLVQRPVSQLWPAGAPTFMQDVYSAYSARLSWLLRPGRRVPGRLNTGVMSFPSMLVDVDALEHFRQRFASRVNPQWSEQTAWAWLAAPHSPRLLDPSQVMVAGGDRDDACVLHFVRSARHLLRARLAGPQDDAAATGSPVRIGTEPAASSAAMERIGVYPRGAAVAVRASLLARRAPS